MKYVTKIMNEQILEEIISWRYDGKYSIYNLEPYEILKKRKSSITDPEKANNYLCYFKNDKLVGYTNLVEKEKDNLFLGIGLSPKYCGKGIGSEILNNTIEVARKKYIGKKIVLKVRSWNERAIKCYKKTGFEVVGKETVKDYNGIYTEYILMEMLL